MISEQLLTYVYSSEITLLQCSLRVFPNRRMEVGSREGLKFMANKKDISAVAISQIDIKLLNT